MDNSTADNNAYYEVKTVPAEKQYKISKKARKRLTVAIILFCIIAPPYALLTFLGLIAYPKWYLLGSFYLNKSSFEYIRDSGENFSNPIYDRYDFAECSDPKLARSIKNVINCHFGEAYWRNNRETLVFRTDNHCGRRNTRGILYSEEEIEWLYDFYYDCRCKPLGGGWYYYYGSKKGEYYDKEG